MTRRRDTDERVQRWIEENPGGSQAECWKALEPEGYSKSTVYSKYKGIKDAEAAAKTPAKRPVGRPKSSEKTDKLTVALTPAQKIRLKTYAAIHGLTPSDVLGDLIDALVIPLDSLQ